MHDLCVAFKTVLQFQIFKLRLKLLSIIMPGHKSSLEVCPCEPSCPNISNRRRFSCSQEACDVTSYIFLLT